jgi:protein TonB
MILAMDWSVNQKREAIAQFGTLVAALVVMVLMQTMVIHQDAPAGEELIQLSILTSPDVPQPVIVPPLQKIQPPEPERVVEEIQPKQVVPATEPPAPVSVQEAVATPVQTVTEKVAIPVQPPAPQAKPVVQEPRVDVSANYEQHVLASLERAKHYPTSREARLTHPEGTVRIWLELDRNGQVMGAGVVDSSGSNLLDSESLHTLRSTSFPPFPKQAYVDQSSHRFIASLKYEISH